MGFTPPWFGVPPTLPFIVSGLPRLQRMIGPTIVSLSAVSVNMPGAVTSIAVRYLPPLPRPTNITLRQTPLIWPRLIPATVFATARSSGSWSVPGVGTKMSEKRIARAIT